MVSDGFPLGGWEPEQSLNIDGHIVHFWIVP
jgi:hypothetical protein